MGEPTNMGIIENRLTYCIQSDAILHPKLYENVIAYFKSDGKRTVRSLAGLRRDSEIIFMNKESK